MADLGPFFRDVLARLPGLSDAHRAEHLAAINEEHPPPPPPPEPELDPAAREARKAELLAELGALEG